MAGTDFGVEEQGWGHSRNQFGTAITEQEKQIKYVLIGHLLWMGTLSPLYAKPCYFSHLSSVCFLYSSNHLVP